MAYGIADIRRQDMIVLDECGVEMTDADRSLGKAYRSPTQSAWAILQIYKDQFTAGNLW